MKNETIAKLFADLDKIRETETFLEKRMAIRSNNSFYHYHLPDIVLTEKMLENYDEYDTDRMGAYYNRSLCRIGSTNNTNIKFGEGYIVLYTGALSECGKSLALASGGNEDEYTLALAKIVLIHELFHWMIYEYPAILSNMFFMKDWPTVDNKMFHESLAQYYTQNKIKQLIDDFLMKVFDELTERQMPNYTVFRGDDDGFCLADYPENKVFLALDLCREKNIQTWKQFKHVLINEVETAETQNKIIQYAETKESGWLYVAPFLSTENKEIHKAKIVMQKLGL
ncbi:MAG: hypothetical protein PHI36_03180 [Bacteroidales bacterium]|jgi:hypothetical protein|nr:hypothetical protein [Bacteroidales bacterium]MDD4575412.1 hypothetical protein [Bacteroidales bacterium]